MKLTEQLKIKIDNMSYDEMLCKWKLALLGEPLFQDESGSYFFKVMNIKKKNIHNQISKDINKEK